ncbi:MAG: adenylyltransferase/cytidyltransferase family protein [Verrucomicrobia bacterium]|jgi:D-glycero-beta-D-manno-heptose 1-phosphate adenylyltransferase|nr:adenylyltransferase/cytidyltransferase family protein [Verrucomicrobiota bacterium]
MELDSKIISPEKLNDWRCEVRGSGQQLVVTNGCFDILHAGHIRYLHSARSEGDLLLVGLNGDESIRQLKGDGRPINPETDRALLLAALECVSAVCVFPEKRATRFLTEAQPDIYVKGGDYTLETLDMDERQAVESANGRIVFIPFVTNRSTSDLITKIRSL